MAALGVPQTRAVTISNNIITQGAALAQIKATLDQIATQYTNLSLATTLAALPTCATNADGSLGTADVTPVVGHVIDNRVISGLSLAIAAFDLGAIITIFQQVSALLAGNTATQQSGAPTLLARIT